MEKEEPNQKVEYSHLSDLGIRFVFETNGLHVSSINCNPSEIIQKVFPIF